MRIRNIKYNKYNTIDCEIEHPEYGWIPFTASPDDVEDHGRQIYNEAISGSLGEIAPYTPPPPKEISWEEARKQAYLPIEDQLDMLYHDMKTGTTTFISHRDSVKAAHPKPE